MHVITDSEYHDMWNNTGEFVVIRCFGDKSIKCFVSRDAVSYKVYTFYGSVGEYSTLFEAVAKFNTLHPISVE